jgi:hypothetical protein
LNIEIKMTRLVIKMMLFLACSASAMAETAPIKLPGNIAVHIAKRHYEHPVRLLHPYLDVWHMKGPSAEKAALKTLNKRFSNVNMCAASSNADVVLLLEPQIFYNAQLRVYHAEIIAKAYTNSTEAITSVKKEAEQNGDLAIKPEFYMEKGYAKAMEKVIKKLETDKEFLATLDKHGENHAETLCGALDDLPVSKIYY